MCMPLSAAAEDIEESALMEVHTACEAASSANRPVDKSTIPGWQPFQESIRSLADEVRQAAPTDLYPLETASLPEQPPAEVQQQQLRCITEVCTVSPALYLYLHTSRTSRCC